MHQRELADKSNSNNGQERTIKNLIKYGIADEKHSSLQWPEDGHKICPKCAWLNIRAAHLFKRFAMTSLRMSETTSNRQSSSLKIDLNNDNNLVSFLSLVKTIVRYI